MTMIHIEHNHQKRCDGDVTEAPGLVRVGEAATAVLGYYE